MLVGEIMHKDIQWVTPEKTVQLAAALMKKHKIGALPVMKDKKAVGMITDRDIAIRCVGENCDPTKTKIEECMSTNVVTISEDESVEKASQTMCDHHLRRLLVINKANHPVGIVTLNHIASKAHDHKLIVETIESFYHHAS